MLAPASLFDAKMGTMLLYPVYYETSGIATEYTEYTNLVLKYGYPAVMLLASALKRGVLPPNNHI